MVTLTCVAAAAAVSADSIASAGVDSQILRELVVQGRRARIEGEKIVVLPSRKERKLSNSPASLVRVLNLPFLHVDGDVITARGNRPVSVYINGQPASAVDMSVFWPMNVNAVEYIENPTDPTYGGDAVVLNFVMREYEIGGTSKLAAIQSLPNSGSYEASAKMQYKSMSYGALVNYAYTSFDVSDDYGTDTYHDIFYRGQRYGELSRTYSSDQEHRSRNLEAALVAKYVKPKVKAEHQIAVVHARTPYSESRSSEQWAPAVYEDIVAENARRLQSTALQASGSYRIDIRSGLFFAGEWKYSYDTGNGSALYTLGSENEIYNSYHSRNHRLNVRLNPYYRTSDKFFTQLRAYGTFSWSNNTYSGNTGTATDAGSADVRAGLRFCWLPQREFWIDVVPGASYTSQWQRGFESYSKVLPWMNLTFFLRMSDKATLRGGASVSSTAPEPSATSDVAVRMSELMTVQGNPRLDNVRRQGGDLRFSWLPSDKFNVSLMTAAAHVAGDYYNLVLPADAASGGLVSTTANGPDCNELKVSASLSGRFLEGDLSLNVNPEFSHSHFAGTGRNLNYLNYRIYASYTFKGVLASLSYTSPRKFMSTGGLSTYRTADSWTFSLGYGTGNLYLRLSARDVFRKYCHSHYLFMSPYYTSDRHTSQRARGFSIDLSYTFDFGKKVYVDIDKPEPEAVRSSVVGDGWGK